MKLHATDHAVQRGGEMIETQFTVRTTAKTFAILSSGLYSDKIAAPIRELCCNAYDAHVAANNAETAFDVQLPNSLDPTFSVRDYGTGLSDDAVRNLYTTYFDSTKTDSDAMIGALGLGSKSPFAYTSSFSIESRHNGLKAMYAAFINENGVPALSALMPPTPTDEPNGMTISFSVRTDDVLKFARTARRVLMYFPVRPNVSGQYDWEPYALSHKTEGTNWKIRTSEYDAHMSGAYVIQGCVAYPLDVSLLADRGLSEVARAVAATSLDLFVPIGDVEVAPSREALSYDPVTVANLIDHLEKAAVEQRDAIQAALDACETMWAARKMLKDLSDSNNPYFAVFAPLNKQDPFLYRGQPIATNITLVLDDITQTAITTLYQYTKYVRRHGTRKVINEMDTWTPESYDTSKRLSIAQQQHTQIIIDDVPKGSKALLDAYAHQYYAQTNKTAHCIVLRASDKKQPIAMNEVDELLIQLGRPETLLLSQMNIPGIAAKKTSYNKRAKGDRLVFTGFQQRDRSTHRVFSRLTWRHETVDFDLGGFYMPMERFNVVYNGNVMSQLDSILDYVAKSGLMDSDELERVYGFAEKDMAAIKDDPSWVNLFDHILELVNDYEPTDAVLAAAGYQNFINDHYHVSSFITAWPKVQKEVADGPFKTFWDTICTNKHNAQNIPGVHQFAVVRNLAQLLNNNDLAKMLSAASSAMTSELKDIVRQYDILQIVDWSRLSSNMSAIVNYVNLREAAQVPVLELAYAA
jgi:hypothetical protein